MVNGKRKKKEKLNQHEDDMSTLKIVAIVRYQEYTHKGTSLENTEGTFIH